MNGGTCPLALSIYNTLAWGPLDGQGPWNMPGIIDDYIQDILGQEWAVLRGPRISSNVPDQEKKSHKTWKRSIGPNTLLLKVSDESNRAG